MENNEIVKDIIKEKVYNIWKLVDDIKEFPQTYNTILKEHISDKTLQFILRRKINRLCKDGVVCKTSIPGTRFGTVIFYYLPKKYHILISAGRLGSDVYCFFDYTKNGRYYLTFEKGWLLKHKIWEEVENITIFEGKVLKWI